MPVQRFRTRPTEVDALQWDGINLAELTGFTGPGIVKVTGGGDQLWNTQERCWLPLPVGHWVIRGLLGEFYPVSPAALTAKYTLSKEGQPCAP